MQLGVSLGIPSTLGRVAAAFSPLDLSPVLWLDASDTSTITESGGAVSQWDDKSGNGYNLTQEIAVSQPTTGTNTINGLNVISYDGAADWLRNVSVPLVGVSRTMFAVYEINALDVAYGLITTSNNPGYAGISQSGSTSAVLSNTMTGTSYAFDGVAFTGTTRGDLYTAVGNSPAIVRVTFTSTTYDGVTFTYTSAGFQFDNGTKVAEIILVASPTAGQIAATEAYLADKWGITL